MTDGEIDGVMLDLKTTLRNFKREFGMEFLERVKAKTPVRTGHLQNSWGFTEKRDDLEIYNTAEYAEYVEYGTERMEPRAMLRATLLEKDQIAEVAAQRSQKNNKRKR